MKTIVINQPEVNEILNEVNENSQVIPESTSPEIPTPEIPTPEIPAVPELSDEEKAKIRQAKLDKLSETGKKLFLIREKEQEQKDEKKRLIDLLKKERDEKKSNNGVNNAGNVVTRIEVLGVIFREFPGKDKAFYLAESDKRFSEITGKALNPKEALFVYGYGKNFLKGYVLPEVTSPADVPAE